MAHEEHESSDLLPDHGEALDGTDSKARLDQYEPRCWTGVQTMANLALPDRYVPYRPWKYIHAYNSQFDGYSILRIQLNSSFSGPTASRVTGLLIISAILVSLSVDVSFGSSETN